ncbi:MAG: stealth family protein [Cyclobacteriaceae bacterium]|nr:stealth family protein [Cyclobacteriaceae bacterium HetDA_MAG_MS6]
MEGEKIDIVYTWVDGADADYIEIVKAYSERPADVNPERYRDTYALLKYSLRSLEKYINWSGKIFLLTARPQVPEWLNADHPDVQVVHHDEVIDEQYLPTFNPNVIESFLHKIPGLSEHFLYINDDFLFGNKTDLSVFYNNGKSTIFNTFFGENLGWRIRDGKYDIIGLGIIEHTPLFIKKEFWEEMTRMNPEEMHKTRSDKFRKPENLMTYKLYRYYMLKHQRGLSKAINIIDLLKVNYFHKITNSLPKQIKGFRKIETEKPKFYCLNDDQRDNPDKNVVTLVKDFLAKNYPEKSAFEK